jgi:hypothetical protein
MVERESTLTIMPPLYLNAKVVSTLGELVPWSLVPHAEAKLLRQ